MRVPAHQSRLRTFTVVGWVMLSLSVRDVAFGARPAAEAGQLRLRAEALDTLYELNLSADQLESLNKLCAGAAGKAPPEVKLSKELRSALVDLCDALAKSDDERVTELQEKVDDLKDQAGLDDPIVPVTDAAKSRAVEAARLLSASQLANLIAQHPDDIAGPDQTLLEAMDDARTEAAEDFAEFRDGTARDVAVLALGYAADTKDLKDLADRAAKFLSRVRELSDDDYRKQRAELEAEARKMVGAVDAFATLHHWVEREMAELMSNPEAPAAIAARHAVATTKESTS